eukprot:TRINITY_DN17003_c0_g1_i1.p1 TRINITY_DN17003_c0_g1~~TRINITY_DN17003_c0_g1_i1.p1  ORF type:complete len:498 (-),score=98.43 TRINITY_DN17003_c0_g1_i1:91-1584(-)
MGCNHSRARVPSAGAWKREDDAWEAADTDAGQAKPPCGMFGIGDLLAEKQAATVTLETESTSCTSAAGSVESAARSRDNPELDLDRSRLLEQHYIVERRRLGKGTFGTVLKASSKANGQICAVKRISKRAAISERRPSKQNFVLSRRLLESEFRKKCRSERIGQAQASVENEIEQMHALQHKNILKLLDYFEDDNYSYLVTEFCFGGNLLQYILQSGELRERSVAAAMKQVFSAIDYMHAHGICHRDIKPENVLVADSGQRLEMCCLKLADFGLCCRLSHSSDDMRVTAGTPYFMSPQVLAGRYNAGADIWSCGVMLYLLLSGRPPFDGDCQAAVFLSIRRGNFIFPDTEWRVVSESAKSMIRDLLRMSPEERLSARRALSHSWLLPALAHRGPQLRTALTNLHRFAARDIAEEDSVRQVLADAAREQEAMDSSRSVVPVTQAAGLQPTPIKEEEPSGKTFAGDDRDVDDIDVVCDLAWFGAAITASQSARERGYQR